MQQTILGIPLWAWLLIILVVVVLGGGSCAVGGHGFNLS